MSIKKLADNAIEWLNERMESHYDSRCASEGEVYMAAMACRIQELEAAFQAGHEYAEVTMQQLSDAGLNSFAVKLLSESVVSNEVTETVKFKYKNVGITIEPLK